MQCQSFGTCPVKNAFFELEKSNKCFSLIIISTSRTCNFFQFLLSIINHYHINGLRLFCDSFEWFCLQRSSDAKYVFLSCSRGIIVVLVYCFQIWNKKEHSLITRVISSHMGPMYIDASCISRGLVSCLGFMAHQSFLVIQRQIHFYENSSISNNSV